MNLPLHRIHSIHYSYGWLLFPTPRGWIAWCELGRLRFVPDDTFHNCTTTGIY